MTTAPDFPDDDNDDVVDNSFDDSDLIPRPEPSKKWVPTVDRPMPSFQCTKIKKNGERCEGHAAMGMLPTNAKCPAHGGKLPSVKEKNRARVDVVRMRIVESTEQAMDTIESLLLPGTADNIRLKAATEILDRAGIRGGVEIDVSGEVTVDSAAMVRERLARLALGKLDEDPEEDIIEGEATEVVDEPENDKPDEDKPDE